MFTFSLAQTSSASFDCCIEPLYEKTQALSISSAKIQTKDKVPCQSKSHLGKMFSYLKALAGAGVTKMALTTALTLACKYIFTSAFP